MLITWIEVKCGDSSRIREKDKTAHRRLRHKRWRS